MPRTHHVPHGTMPHTPLKTDAQFHAHTDTSEPIATAYANLGRISNPSARMCESARVWGQANAIRSVTGAPKGEAPACGTVGKHWHRTR